ncbi:MAG: hypothetical protein AAFY60_16250, partial [Myxococcota bacterium]
LPASAFAVRDQDTPVFASVIQNGPATPRILFILDDSNSVPEEFRGPAGAALVRDIAERVGSTVAGSEFRILKVGGSRSAGFWTNDVEELETQALDLSSFGSELWESLENAQRLQPTTCVMITDGVASDEESDVNVERLKALPPCVFVRVADSEGNTSLEDMSALTGGELIEEANPTLAATAIEDFAVAASETVYVIQYRAPLGDPAIRTVTLSVGDTNASAQYEVPAVERQPPRVVGLELVVSQRGRPDVKRMLAGSRDPNGPALVREFFARRTLAFEVGAPILHETLDELLDSKLGLEPLATAVDSEDEEQILAELARGRRFASPEVLALLSRFGETATGPDVFPQGLRTALFTVSPLEQESRLTAIDLFPGPSVQTSTNATDGRSALLAVLNATAPMALTEEGLFETSTQSLIGDAELVYLAPGESVESLFPDLTAEDAAQWERALET